MTLEEVDELEFVKMCYQETMRRDTPAAISSTNTVLKATTFDTNHFVPGDPFYVGLHWIHRDPEQWIEPEKFVPERFDPESTYFKRPDGGRRSHHAFSPFLGGSRVCLGKTFAEVTLKFTLPMYFHYFNFELVNEEHKKERPIVWLGSTSAIEIPIKFITKNKVPDDIGEI